MIILSRMLQAGNKSTIDLTIPMADFGLLKQSKIRVRRLKFAYHIFVFINIQTTCAVYDLATG